MSETETDYLTILVAQTLGVAQSIQPLIPPIFSPAQFPPPTVGADLPRPLADLSRSRVPGASMPTHKYGEPTGGRGEPVPTWDAWAVGADLSRPPSPQIMPMDTGHDQPANRRNQPAYGHDESANGRGEPVPTVNDAPHVIYAHDATDSSSKNKNNPLQLQSLSSTSRDISQPSLSRTSVSQPIHVPQASISVEPSLLGADGQPQGSTPRDIDWSDGRPQGSTPPDMDWSDGRPQGSTPPPTPPPPLLYNEKNVREAHSSVYSRGEGGRVGWGGPLRSPVEPLIDGGSLRSPVEAPTVPEPITHTKANPSNFVGINVVRSSNEQHVGTDSSRPQADSSHLYPHSPVGTDLSRPQADVSHPLEPVRVTIGRVEVRAMLPAQEPSQRTQATQPARPTLSLQSYLEQRRSRKA